MHTPRRGDRVLLLACGTGLLALLAGAVLLTVVLLTQGVDRANAWAGVVSAGVAIVGALVALVAWWLRQRAAARQPARSDQLTQAAQELQATVREQWRKEAEARSLGDPDPMPVRWRLSDPGVMDHNEHIASARLVFSGRSDRIPALTDQFRRLRRRRLVIVGGPGAGKTTLAVQLLLQLLEGWQAVEPVPVLFSLANWDPKAQIRVQDWLAAQLNQTYPDLRAFGTDTAQRLAEQGRLLPVLDGLDEIPADRRGQVIEALNASLHPDTGVILTSRTTEYTETVHTCDVLTAAAVIQPEPLTPSEASRYLEDRLPRRPGDSWQTVLTALRAGTAGPLAEVVARPLWLWLLRVVHIEGRHDPRPLIDDPKQYPDAAAIQHHLLESFIPAAYRPHPDPKRRCRWSLTQAEDSLVFLAQHLDQNIPGKTDLAWWELRYATPLPFVGLVAGLITGLMGGLLGGLGAVGHSGGFVIALVIGESVGLTIRFLRRGPVGRFEAGLARGFAGGLVGALITVPLGGLTAGGITNGLAVGLWVGPVCGPLGGFVGSIAGGLVSGFLGTLKGGVIGGAADGLAAGLGVGITVGLAGRRTPAQGSRWSPVGLLAALPVGFAAGVVATIVAGIEAGLAFGFAVALVTGLPGGLPGGLTGAPVDLKAAAEPAAVLVRDRRTFVVVGLTVGLVAGLWVGIATSLQGQLINGIEAGLAFGFAVGLGAGALQAVWGTFTIIRCWLALRHRLPWRLMRFLSDAHQRGVLRQDGANYQFRHRELQQHLARSKPHRHRPQSMGFRL